LDVAVAVADIRVAAECDHIEDAADVVVVVVVVAFLAGWD
jgi:hypothetical protein